MASYAYKALEQYNSESQIHNEIMKITSKKSSRKIRVHTKWNKTLLGRGMCLCTYGDKRGTFCVLFLLQYWHQIFEFWVSVMVICHKVFVGIAKQPTYPPQLSSEQKWKGKRGKEDALTISQHLTVTSNLGTLHFIFWVRWMLLNGSSSS